jgi:hypothetical protein
MGTPVWTTTDTNLGTVQHYIPFIKTIGATNTVDYAVVNGAMPPGVLLNSVTGVLSGVPVIQNPLSNIPIVIFTFTVRATSGTGEYTDKIFKMPVLYSGLFVPTNLSQNRIRFVNNNYQYQILRGTVDTSTNTYWRLEFGELPPGLILYQNGTIEGVSPRAALPLAREQFLKSNAPQLSQLNQASWDNWLRDFISRPLEFDHQFVLRLASNTGATQLSVTVRILYAKIPSSASWFVTNAEYVTYDPNQYYTFIVVSDNDYINWETPQDLGSLPNGSISELSIVATNNLNKQINYSIKPYYISTLPQQLTLLNNGLISGRVGFKCHQDDPANFPENDDYYFTVRAVNSDRFTYVERTFRLHIERTNTVPYHNIWIRSFPTIAERQNLDRILENEILFPSRLLYRNLDPWFSKTRHLRFLFAPGLNDATMDQYNTALASNHYNKILTFGEVQTAVCYDENLRIKYEVVYLPVIDRLTGFEPGINNPASLPDVIDLRPQIKNYYFENGHPYYIFRPNGLENMRHRLATTVGFYNQGIIPGWMTSVQPIPEKIGQFYAPPGFIPAVVLAYTVAGGSSVIAFRLRRAGINFNNFKFEFDRYELDKKLSEVFNAPAEEENTGTTFDDNVTKFEDGSTKFNNGVEYVLGLTGTGPYVGNKYLKFPKTGAFT